jgi:hypothetical protein
MYPLVACAEVAGFPITSLFRETPLAAIWKRADCGQAVDEVYRRPLHVVYSVVPSLSYFSKHKERKKIRHTVVELERGISEGMKNERYVSRTCTLYQSIMLPTIESI